MKLIPFPEQTVVVAKDQPEYDPMPAHHFSCANNYLVSPNERRIVCCWQMTWRERLRVLFTGKVWHQILTFGQPIQPVLLQVEKPKMQKP